MCREVKRPVLFRPPDRFRGSSRDFSGLSLVISTQFDEITYKAARNIQPVLLNTAAEVNTEQLLAFQKIIVTNEALAKLAERLA